MTPRIGLLLALGLFSVIYVAFWIAAAWGKFSQVGWPSFKEDAVGFVTNFFDTLGIGSFAPTTSVFKFWHMVDDEKIPGTLNVGHCAPTLVEAFLFILVVNVDMTTLVAMIAASVAGSYFGAGIVSKWPRRTVQIGMGIALLVAATIFTMQIFKLFPGGGDALKLEGWSLAAGVAGNFVLGALMTLGIGLYGPCMILVSLLAMNPKAAFPIMMGSCAFLMPVGSIRFIRANSYSMRPALGLALGGIPGVLIATYIVKELPIEYIRPLVVIVVLYTAAMMLKSAFAGKAQASGTMVP
jgi:uncharacterized membrane protein YfcA